MFEIRYGLTKSMKMRRTEWWMWWYAKKWSSIPLYRRPSRCTGDRHWTSLFDTMSTWTNAHADTNTRNIMDAETLFWREKSIKNNWHKNGSGQLSRVSRSACPWSGNISCIFLQKYWLKQQIISKQAESNRIKLPCESTYVFDVKYPPNTEAAP